MKCIALFLSLVMVVAAADEPAVHDDIAGHAPRDTGVHTSSSTGGDTPSTREDTPRDSRAGHHTNPCTENEMVCWINGTLVFSNGSCYEPLKRGPCSEGQWLRRNATLPSQKGACFKQPCPAGQFPDHSGVCLVEDEASQKICHGSHVHFDAWGNTTCGPKKSWKEMFSTEGACGSVHAPADVPTSPHAPVDVPTSPHTSAKPPITSTVKPCVKKSDGTCKSTAIKHALSNHAVFTVMSLFFLTAITA